MPPPPPITRALLIACTVLLFVCHVPALQNPLILWLTLTPVQGGFFFGYQALTYALVHIDPFQWFFNMMGLYFFGSELENLWGERRFVQFLLASVLMGALFYVVLTLVFGPSVPLVGSTGALLGMLVAFGVLFPNRPLSLYFVVQVRMRTAVLVFIGIEVFMMLGNMGGLAGAWIGNLSHLGGALGAYLMILYWRWRPPSFRRTTKKPPLRRVH
jgi:membrane associated rhomboid family serine protease